MAEIVSPGSKKMAGNYSIKTITAKSVDFMFSNKKEKRLYLAT
jgi:hypothetical protein